MYYLDTKNDQSFFNSFKDEVLFFYETIAAHNEFSKIGCFYEEDKKRLAEVKLSICKSRQLIAKNLNKAVEISNKYGVSTNIVSTPAPMVGGMLIPVNIYHAILNDNSHGRQVTEQLVMDHVFQTIGQIERQLKSDVKNVFNPIFWLKFIFVKVIRFPFVVLSFTGFDIKKIEDHLISKVVKCVEVALLVWIFLRFGFSFDQIAGLFKGFISR